MTKQHAFEKEKFVSDGFCVERSGQSYMSVGDQM
jgi:hypothetical protein